MSRTRHTLFILAALFLCAPLLARASQLRSVSDRISTSATGANASQDISFVTTSDIPAGGSVHVRFDGDTADGDPFVFGPGFDFTNVGFSVDQGSGEVPYPLYAYQDISTSTATLLPNGDGEVAVTLALDASYAIPTGSRVHLMIGAGASTTIAVQNPETPGSYRYTVTTFDEAGRELGRAVGLLAITSPVGMASIVRGRPVVISNGLPKGLLPGGLKHVVMSVDTDLPATCRYSLKPNVEYAAVLPIQTFASSQFQKHHEVLLDTADDTHYTFYVRCFAKYSLMANEEDYPIDFEIGVVPKEHYQPPPPIGTQEGDHTGGGNGLPMSGLGISGRAFPGAHVSILKDGKDYKTMTADGSGTFQMTDSGFNRGTYGFNIIATDGNGLSSANYTTTLSLSASTYNTIGPVMMSPTLSSKTNRISAGGTFFVTGSAIPSSMIQLVVLTAIDPLQAPLVIATTSSDGSGRWSMNVPTEKLTKGSYSVRAQSITAVGGASLFSTEFLLGVGQQPIGDNKKRADLNHDGRVNIADLSILLFNWGKHSGVADINGDGNINLTDFSIMLSAWTG